MIPDEKEEKSQNDLQLFSFSSLKTFEAPEADRVSCVLVVHYDILSLFFMRFSRAIWYSTYRYLHFLDLYTSATGQCVSQFKHLKLKYLLQDSTLILRPHKSIIFSFSLEVADR